MLGFVKLDIICNGGTPAVVASYSDDARDEPIARAVAAARTAYGVTGLRLSVSRSRGDDQDAASFWAEDIPVPYMYEEEMSPHWHEITDTVENVNVDQIELRTKAVVGAIVDLAR